MLPFLLALLALGCSGKDEGDNGGDDTSGDNGGGNGGDNGGDTGETEDTTPPPWEPTSGTYLVTPGAVLEDTCKFPDDGGGGDSGLTQASSVDIQVAEDQSSITMTIPAEDGGKPVVVVCPRTEYSFHCDVADVEDSETAGQYGLEATITLSIDQDGTWADETHIDGVYTWATNCLGPDCGTVEAVIGGGFRFPCGGRAEYTADLE